MALVRERDGSTVSASITTFDSTKEALLDLLRDIREGKIQLPDFQRGWVWDDDHVRGLLASVSDSYPIGAVMLLQTGNAEVRFKPRLVEGVEHNAPADPERLILDGQQRLTTLLQALYSPHPVATRDARGRRIVRWYYFDICKALDLTLDSEESIIALPEDRVLRNFRGEPILDVSTAQLEFQHGLFPASKIFDYSDWQMEYQEFWDYDRDKTKLFNQFVSSVVKRFEQYQIPVIVLRKETPKEAVCQVFEKVNTGGVQLTVFELLTATYAADDYNLRDDWDGRARQLRSHRGLRTLDSTAFLQAVTLMATRARRASATEPGAAISCKRKDILRLTLDDYREWADLAMHGFERAARFLQSQHIFDARDVPYATQLTPLATILALLGDRGETDGIRSKLARWYWCGVFGELYGSAIETRFAKDVPQVLDWLLDGGPEPDTVAEAHFAPSRLRSLRTRNSAAYKGLYALILRDGAQDFRTGVPIDVHVYFEDRIDIHHIFPQAWCRRMGIDRALYDSIVNKTALSARTNRSIGGRAPQSYLAALERSAEIAPSRMDEILRSHAIDPDALRRDDFEAFYRVRETALLEKIELATGKPVVRDVVDPLDYLLADEDEMNVEEEVAD